MRIAYQLNAVAVFRIQEPFLFLAKADECRVTPEGMQWHGLYLLQFL